MGTQIITQPQTFKTPSTVMGTAAGLSAVAGLTVYGDISASGTIYGVPTAAVVPVSTTYTFNGSVSAFAINGFTNTTASNYLVYLDGVHQVSNIDYSLSATSGGGNVLMSSVPTSGVVANVVAFQSAVAAYALSGVRPVVSSGTGTGSQTAFSVTGYTDSNPQNYLVTVGGLVQKPGVDYTVSANTINFTSAVPNSAPVLIIAWQTTPSTTAASLYVASEGGSSSGSVASITFSNGLSARVADGAATVQLPEATIGQVLTYSGTTSTWVASAAPGSSGGAIVAANAAKAWVSFTTSAVISGSYNVSSVTKTSVGHFVINYITPMSNSTYCAFLNPNSGGTNTAGGFSYITSNLTISSCNANIFWGAAAYDPTGGNVMLVVFAN